MRAKRTVRTVRTVRNVDPERLGRVGVLVGVWTLVLTAGFLGVVALATGAATGAVERLPLYVLVMAGAFVAAVVLFQEAGGGPTVLAWAGGLALVAFALVGLGVEGLLFAAANPGEALSSHLLVYVLAAAMIGTGLGYWGLYNWQAVAEWSTPKAPDQL